MGVLDRVVSSVSSSQLVGPRSPGRPPAWRWPRWAWVDRWFGRSRPAHDDGVEPWLGRLVAGVVHEMNTPLGAMASSADTIEALSRRVDALVDDPEVTAHLQTLRQLAAVQQQTAVRLTDTVRSLERFVDLDRSDRREVDLVDTIRAALDVLGAQGDSRVRLVAIESPRLVTSPRLLNRVIVHTLERALAAAPTEGTVEVTVHGAGRGHVAISIRDTGRALDDAEIGRLGLPRLAERGTRIALDLGWATSQRALHALGGTMTVQSGEGQGTTVTVRLPSNAKQKRQQGR